MLGHLKVRFCCGELLGDSNLIQPGVTSTNQLAPLIVRSAITAFHRCRLLVTTAAASALVFRQSILSLAEVQVDVDSRTKRR